MTYLHDTARGIDPAAFLDALPDLAFLVDDGGRVVFANETCRLVLGLDPDELGAHALEFVHPDDAAVVATSMLTIRHKSCGTPIEFRIRHRSGTWRWVELVASNRVADPEVGGFICIARDITDRRRWEIAGSDTARFQHVFHHGAALTLLLDATGRILGTNNAFNRLLGYDKSHAIGRPLALFADAGSSARLQRAIVEAIATGSSVAIELTMHRARPDEPARLMRFELRSLESDSTSGGIVATGQDITALDATRRELDHLATHDPLTGLANRTRLERSTEQLLATGEPFALMFVDLDGFKQVNDRFGHRHGDRMLAAVGRRLAKAIRATDVAARLGGDEFVVLAAGIADHRTARALAIELELAIATPYAAEDVSVSVRASTGIAISRPSATFDELVSEADADMYARKRVLHRPAS